MPIYHARPVLRGYSDRQHQRFFSVRPSVCPSR